MTKPHTWINASRGGLVDTKALIDAPKTGKFGSAGLDVYEEEAGIFFHDMSDKVMTDDVLARLMTFNNVVVTSHQAFLTREALANIAETTLANIGQYRDGKRGADLHPCGQQVMQRGFLAGAPRCTMGREREVRPDQGERMGYVWNYRCCMDSD